ncbi:MAG: O-antigen ligase family protein [Saprospiraceae bacterium]
MNTPYSHIRVNRKRVIATELKLLAVFGYLMAFPVFLLGGINLSLYLFPVMILNFSAKVKTFKIHSKPQLFACFFGLGAIISVLTIDAQNDDSLSRALAVLPNYIYWSALVIFILNIWHFVNLTYTSKFIFLGVLTSVLYYQVQDFINLPVLNNFAPNSYAFLLVCYTAPSVAYIAHRYGKNQALLFLAVVLLSLLLIGRRAGFVLVFGSSLGALYLGYISFGKIIRAGFIGLVLFASMQLSIVEGYILQSSPRMHELFYENDNLAATDQSILVRKLQVEKGLDLFNKNLFTGIGLNNFSNYEGVFKGDFEGSKIVLRKKQWNNKSAHNSYIALMAEGGLFLFVPFVLIILYNLYGFIISANRRTPLETAFYWSFFGMCTHLYFITGIVNVYPWFLIAVVSAISVKYARFKKRHPGAPLRRIKESTPIHA